MRITFPMDVAALDVRYFDDSRSLGTAFHNAEFALDDGLFADGIGNDPEPVPLSVEQVVQEIPRMHGAAGGERHSWMSESPYGSFMVRGRATGLSNSLFCGEIAGGGTQGGLIGAGGASLMLSQALGDEVAYLVRQAALRLGVRKGGLDVALMIPAALRRAARNR